LVRESAGHGAAAPGKVSGATPRCSVLVALKIVLQIAVRNIGQLTDMDDAGAVTDDKAPAPLTGRLKEASEGRAPESDATVAKLMDE
jgi:hypothetical protein